MNHKIVAFIPARGGSKGIPGKNICEFAGKPLIVHSIEQALGTQQIESVYVSSDDPAILKISENAGAMTINRPLSISGDTATTESAIDHFLKVLEADEYLPDIIVLLQATSPHRPENSLSHAIDHFLTNKFDSLVSLSPTHHFFWKIDDLIGIPQYDFMNRPRRQDMKTEDIRYTENGSFYIFTRRHFKKSGNRLGGKIGYWVLPEEYGMQIDTEIDFKLLEEVFRSERNQ